MRARLARTFLLILCGLALAGTGRAATAPPGDAAQLRAELEPLIDFLDSALYAQLATWEEHLVLTYERAAGRLPTPVEAAVLTGLRARIGLPRSAVLAIALRGESGGADRERLRAFAGSAEPRDFVPDPGTAARLPRVSPETLRALLRKQLAGRRAAPGPAAPAVEAGPADGYSIYFGYLHAHSALSDGEGDPLDAYLTARDVAGLDFFALTDHGEFLGLWPWERRWEQLVAAADATDMPGSFAALWGFEWSNPLLGHLNILGSDDFTGALSTFSLPDLYEWIAARPATFARFNHPGDYDLLRTEFLHFLPLGAAREQIVGIETWNGNSDFDDYFYPPGYRGRFRYLDEANRLGWRLGALGGQDNHSPDWGMKNDFRTAVLAASLTREGIAEAFRARRFYATEDKDLELRFSSGGRPMGSRLHGLVRELDVQACDGSGDDFSEVRLYRNGVLLERRPVDGTCFDERFTDMRLWPAYYYVVVAQADDGNGDGRADEAVSSPIWFTWR
jgi:hypothetical protein